MKSNFWIYLSLILITAVWGGSFTAIKHLLEVFSPTELIFARFFPAALILIMISIIFYPKETVEIVKRDFWKVLAVGLVGTPGYHFALNYGETKISAGLASLIIGLNPSLTFIVSLFILREKPRIAKIIGLFISFLGLFVLVRFGSNEGLSYSYLLAVFITILSPVCWAFYTTISKPLTMKHPPLVVAAVTTAIGTIPAFVFVSKNMMNHFSEMKMEHFLSLGYLSILATVIGNIAWMSGVKRITATRVSSFVYCVPLFAVIIGVIVLHETINLPLVVGGLLIMGGVWVTNKHF